MFAGLTEYMAKNLFMFQTVRESLIKASLGVDVKAVYRQIMIPMFDLCLGSFLTKIFYFGKAV